MRDLINLVDGVLTESRGIGARRMGEEFVSTKNPNDKIYVNTVAFYPDDRPHFANEEERNAALKAAISGIKNATISLISQFKEKDRAFGIAIFDRPNKQKLIFIKPFVEVKPDPTKNSWDNQRGLPGYKFNSKVAAKSLAGVMPQDVLKSKATDLTPSDIIEQIAAKFGAKHILTKAAQSVASGIMPITIPADPEIGFTAFRDYFCELLHPIALVVGNYRGDVAQAAQSFLGTQDFSNTLISFGADKTEGLSDSILIGPDGRKVKVSSKGGPGGGAPASSKNLLDCVRDAEVANKKLVRKYSDVIDIIKTVENSSQEQGPLVLGVQFGIIGPADVKKIIELKKQYAINMSDIKKLGLSKKLTALALGRKAAKPESVNMFFHCIAAVAHAVAKHVNENTEFSEAASQILNNGALIQVYTKASDKGNTWVINSFEPKWPGDDITAVKFSAGKTYFSTYINGKFTFKIITRGFTDVETDDTSGVIEPDMTDIETPTVKPGAAPKDIRSKAAKAARQLRGFEPKKADLGREER